MTTDFPRTTTHPLPPSHRFRWLALLLVTLAPVAVCAPSVTGVGMAPIHIPDPVSGGQTDGYVFYPSPLPVDGTTAIGPYNVAAIPDAPALPGAKPLVVISHGHGGSRLGHHDLAAYLASHGFIVATLNHPKDDFEDAGGAGHIEVLAGRPIQVKSTITTLLGDPRWQNLIDANRIGVAGFSAGGYTSLLIAGAKPRFSRFIGYCERHPDDAQTCGDAPKFKAEAAKSGHTLEQVFDDMQGELGRWGDTADPRVKAAFVMAPLSLIFDEHGFDNVHIPLFLYYGQYDHVLLPDENARYIRPMLKTLVAVKEVPKADHWVFLPPCSDALAKDIGPLCSDPPGVDRAKVHAQINADALAFFRKTLDVQGR